MDSASTMTQNPPPVTVDLEALKARRHDVTLADYSLPRFDALRALDHLLERALDIPVIVVSGSQQGIDLATRLLLEPGDRVCIEEPGYPRARAVFEALGARLADGLREAARMAGIVERDLPFDNAAISERSRAEINNLTRRMSILDEDVPYADIVAVQFRDLWRSGT